MLYMKLEDTVRDMVANNFKCRFRAEYHQLCIRIKGIQSMLNKWDNLPLKPKSSRETIELQLDAMLTYKNCLEARASVENITL